MVKISLASNPRVINYFTTDVADIQDTGMRRTDETTGRSLKVFLLLLSLVLGFLTYASSAGPQASGTFIPTGNMITPRVWHTATLLNNGQVLITGGEQISTGQQVGISSAELYDPDNGSFVEIRSMTTVRALHSATLLPDGKVLIAGGRRDGGRQLLASAELYDPDTRTFTSTGDMTVARIQPLYSITARS